MADSCVFGNIETDDGLPDMSALSTRLNSFQAFPHSEQVPAERLARAGFYFTGESDRVCCFSCLHTIENWHQGDCPLERHLSVSPTCMFLRCVHHKSLPGGSYSQSPVTSYDDEAEAMEFRLRTGEVVDESLYPKIPHMKSEDARLRTFNNWPSWSPVQPNDLAEAGMFYVPESNVQLDRVQCFCCAGMLVSWEEGDNPWQEHARVYPNCLFILGHDVGNIPSEQPRQRSSDRGNSMKSFEERLESFRDRAHPINHERLARAGFYSTGDLDCVVCFKCGGHLKDWKPNEDPWEEHAKHYPGCSFLLAETGLEFINGVQLRSTECSSAYGFSRQERSGNLERSHEGHSYVVNKHIQDITGGDSDRREETETEDPLKKLEKLQHEKLCKVCMDSDIAIVFIPCGHLVTCKKCSESLHKCPICCAEITQKIKTYCS